MLIIKPRIKLILSVVILSNDLEHQYQIVMAEKCIEACLDSLERGMYHTVLNNDRVFDEMKDCSN